MYFTFDTSGFMETDYDKFKGLRGFSVRESHGAGKNNRGRLILADRLLLPDMDTVLHALPDGYTITDSTFSQSAGTLCAPAGLGSEELSDECSDGAAAVRRTIAARGVLAGLSLLSDLTVLEILTKSKDILPLLQEILRAAAADDFASCNILDIYKGIPKLRIMYWEDEKKREGLQQQFDRLCSGTLHLSDIRNPYDALYQKGMAALLHINIS